MIASHVLLAGGWIAFCVLHSVFASLNFKQSAQRWMGAHYKYYRLYYTSFALVFFFGIMGYLFWMRSYRLFLPPWPVTLVGIVITFAGLLLMLVCILKYFVQLSGLRRLVSPGTKNTLMITGVHKFVRHPLYAGTFVFIWGLAIIFPFLKMLIVDIIVTVYTLIGVRLEEKKLEEEFGESYRAYRANVPMFIPRRLVNRRTASDVL